MGKCVYTEEPTPIDFHPTEAKPQKKRFGCFVFIEEDYEHAQYSPESQFVFIEETSKLRASIDV